MIWSEPGETKDWLGGGFWRQSENMVNERKERDQRRDSIVKRMRINTSVWNLLSVTSEAPLRVGNRTLSPMGVEMKDQRCEAYFLLRRRGNTEDLKYTPYFFVSETERNDSVEHLLNGGPGRRDLSHEDVTRN